MSLYKQLALLITTLFLLLFAGTFLLNFNSTQAFLINQMETQVDDTATSLGLSITPYLLDADSAGVQTTVNAIFDRGYYREILVTDIDGVEIASRQQVVVIDGVPAWFVKIIGIEAPVSQRGLSAGWAIGGELLVAGHPGYAYQQLWRSVGNSFIWYLLAAIALLLLGRLALKTLLTPLVEVTKQAEAVCARHYDVQVELPRTMELRTVVSAMNRMTSNVKNTFNKQSQTANRLRKMAYQDSLTGVGNKRYFQTQLKSMLEDEQAFKAGALLLLQLNDYKGYNERNGYQDGDRVLVALSDAIKANTASFEGSLLGRLNGGDFAMYIANISSAQADALAAELASALADLFTNQLYDISAVGHIGVVMIEDNEQLKVGNALGLADAALRKAQADGENSWHRMNQSDTTDSDPKGRSDWTQFLSRAVENSELKLLTQKVVDSHESNVIMHEETFVQINDEEGKPYPAAMFIASAEQMGLSHKIDRFVISKIVDHMLSLTSGKPSTFAINLSMNSLKQPGFLDWLLPVVKQLPGDGSKRLIFEFPESTVINNVELVKEFATALRGLGHGVALDHFGRGFSDFGYLKTLRPEYVKIDRAYTTQAHDDPETQFFVTSLCGICKSLEIQVIAQAVEDLEQWNTLKSLHVDGVQGWGIGRPALLDI